ncbi:MAG TPA: helix-turn-helix domain-containing protein [Sporichthyaceae bacterium]|nr:helix-turn-helix domain-containing protein [Sporichthyaceae bacterium]
MKAVPEGSPDPGSGSVQHPTRAELSGLADAIDADLDQIAAAVADAIEAHVAAYRRDDPTLMPQVVRHARDVFQALVTCLREDRAPQPQDLPATPAAALNRVSHGISLADFLRASRIATIMFWNRLVPLLGPHASPALIARTVYLLLQVMELSSSTGAEALLEAEQFRGADRDRLRRDVVEDLLEGRPPLIGPRRGILDAAGLRQDVPFVVASVQPIQAAEDTEVLGRVRAAVRFAEGRTAGGLLVIRYDEVLGLFPTTDAGTVLAEGLRAAHQELRRVGVDVRAGISTPQLGWDYVARGHREACTARDAVGESGGVSRVSAMSALNYLTLHEDETARRLIDPRVRAFVEDELSCGGSYLETLDAYVGANLNAKVAAERLGVHVNTAYYRLDRIAERTGQDLRTFEAVLDLVVAVRLLRGRSRNDR